MARLRDKRVTICMTEDEYSKYLKKVKKSKLTSQEYGLKTLLDKEIYVVDGIQELAMQIRKIGVNINQVVHLVNEERNIKNSQIEELDEKMNEVWKLLNDFAKSIKR